MRLGINTSSINFVPLFCFEAHCRWRDVDRLTGAGTHRPDSTMATEAFDRGKSAASCLGLRRLHDGRIGTVAATGKDPHQLGGGTMATAPFGRG
jgi:hypothetical protein